MSCGEANFGGESGFGIETGVEGVGFDVDFVVLENGVEGFGVEGCGTAVFMEAFAGVSKTDFRTERGRDVTPEAL